jgi:hypothetical protein
LKNLYLLPAITAICLLTGVAMAQTVVNYASPIADYKAFVDEKITPWKAANDKVGQIGGWRAYAKEAQQPDNTPAPATMQKPVGSSGDAMKPDPHAGHKK